MLSLRPLGGCNTYLFSKKTGAAENTAIVAKAEDMYVQPMYLMLSGQKEYGM